MAVRFYRRLRLSLSELVQTTSSFERLREAFVWESQRAMSVALLQGFVNRSFNMSGPDMTSMFNLSSIDRYARTEKLEKINRFIIGGRERSPRIRCFPQRMFVTTLHRLEIDSSGVWTSKACSFGTDMLSMRSVTFGCMKTVSS